MAVYIQYDLGKNVQSQKYLTNESFLKHSSHYHGFPNLVADASSAISRYLVELL